MKSFFISLITASVVGALSTSLVCKNYEKYVKYIAALICTVIVISPISEVFSQIKALLSTEETAYTEPEPKNYSASNELIAKKTEETAEAYVSQLVFSDLGISTAAIDIEIESKDGEFIIKTVTAKTTDKKDREILEPYLENLFGEEPQIEVT